MDLLKAMTVFVRVVDTGSLSAAALACDLSPTMVGNYLQALETQLGTRLIHRTTRKQQVSAFGHAYYERCVEILGLVDDAQRLASDHHASPRGKLRITAPIIFSSECLMPALADYSRRFPDVQLDIVASDTLSDLLDDGFEAAIRIGTAAVNPDFIARALLPYRLVLVASPAYLDEHGRPTTPDDLRAHQCLTYAYPPRSDLHAAHAEWRLTKAGDERGNKPGNKRGDKQDEPRAVPVGGRLKIDNAQALRRAVLAGLGIAMLPEVLVRDDLEAGRLARVLPGFDAPQRPLSLLYLRDRQMSPKLRGFIDFIVERFGAASAAAE